MCVWSDKRIYIIIWKKKKGQGTYGLEWVCSSSTYHLHWWREVEMRTFEAFPYFQIDESTIEEVLSHNQHTQISLSERLLHHHLNARISNKSISSCFGFRIYSLNNSYPGHPQKKMESYPSAGDTDRVQNTQMMRRNIKSKIWGKYHNQQNGSTPFRSSENTVRFMNILKNKILVWLGFMTYQPLWIIYCQILSIYIYIY